ncbi:thiamine phosphate synthase [Methylobacterium aerolatum]|uniref:Thiamine-phosphate pyrophosphorylase n=1 Tax=Methylobacterium aerolatum TaxID=418708 RepID=A0ABU0HYD4_9HYPH|nr:thiamine phosphate synthase [Methylobacterium aerolatum]MDQ0446710.1 thiamine-phosphate pyrophosphorylase [Methylobacterium aerolatum]GJD33677.1 Thiamine-phosphate synthase [Methylobacterium aerolatum]
MSLPSPLLAVTDRHGHARPLAATVRAVIAGGGRWIWFRDRDLPPDERRRLGETVADTVRAAEGFLIVGGDPDLAVILGAGGVHLPGGAPVSPVRDRLGGVLLGVSAHSLREVEAAALAGADYVTLSPIFPTASKPGYGPALGPEAIAAARGFGIPVVALGGIGEGTLPACREAGAAGFAVMGGVMHGEDPEGATRALLAGWADRGIV